MADTRPDRGNGSRLYEVNIWMWRYGRGLPRKTTVASAKQAQRERVKRARQTAAETLKRRRQERQTDD